MLINTELFSSGIEGLSSEMDGWRQESSLAADREQSGKGFTEELSGRLGQRCGRTNTSYVKRQLHVGAGCAPLFGCYHRRAGLPAECH